MAEKRRSVTSAVPGMPVAKMRSLLAMLRARFATQDQDAPFSLGEELEPGVVAWEFSAEVAKGLHRKRTSSRAQKALVPAKD